MNNSDNCSNLNQLLDWVLKDNETDQSLFTNGMNTADNVQAINDANHKSSNNSTSEDDELTDAQLKLLPSKERRQIRNKISARNFRNRRKEYLASLETKIERYESENNQLKFEVKWVRDLMNKLQIENDRLRLELVLCKGGVQPTQALSTITTTNTLAPTPIIPLSTPNDLYTQQPNMNWNMNMFNSTAPSNIIPNISPVPSLPSSTTATIIHAPFNSSTTHTLFPGLPSNNADANIRSASSTSSDDASDQSTLPVLSDNNIFIAHASLPNWDLSSVLDKTNNILPSVELIRTYPLLAPALMSIVIQHTMSLTSKQLSLPNPPANEYQTGFDDTIQALPYREEDKFIASLSDTILWENIIQSTAAKEVAAPVDEAEEKEKERLKMLKYLQEHCPLIWIQKQFCKFILFYVIVKYPKLSKPCRTYLPICDKFRIRN